jgi:hypothetical protein
MSIYERSVCETLALVMEFLRKMECRFAVRSLLHFTFGVKLPFVDTLAYPRPEFDLAIVHSVEWNQHRPVLHRWCATCAGGSLRK